MKINRKATEKDWNLSLIAFQNILHFEGSTMLVRKIIFSTYIYYEYLVQKFDCIKRSSILYELYKGKLKFTYYHCLDSIIE
jgi:hypothetical protein